MRRHILIAVMLVLCHATEAMADAAAKTMSATTHRRLQAIEQLMADNKLQKAAKKLDAFLVDMPRSKADCAYVHYTSAMLHLQRNDYQQARSHLIAAYELDSFPEKTLLHVLQNLAGLCMQAEDFKTAVAYYRSFMARSTKPNEDIAVGLGVAHFHLKEYAAAVKVLTTAIGQFEPRPLPYQILFSSYYELRQLSHATQTLEKMIRLWPDKTQYWFQLAGIYIEQKAYEKSLEIMQSALTMGFITKERDLLQYVHTLYEKHLPYKAATVLERAIAGKIVDENQKNYEMLATLYQEAKERLKAIEALKNASAYTQNGKNDLYIAQLYFEMENAYNQVVEYGQRAIQKGIQQAGSAHMLIAASYSELGQLENTTKHLNEARRFKGTQKESSLWLKFLSGNKFPEKNR